MREKNQYVLIFSGWDSMNKLMCLQMVFLRLVSVLFVFFRLSLSHNFDITHRTSIDETLFGKAFSIEVCVKLMNLFLKVSVKSPGRPKTAYPARGHAPHRELFGVGLQWPPWSGPCHGNWMITISLKKVREMMSDDNIKYVPGIPEEPGGGVVWGEVDKVHQPAFVFSSSSSFFFHLLTNCLDTS